MSMKHVCKKGVERCTMKKEVTRKVNDCDAACLLVPCTPNPCTIGPYTTAPIYKTVSFPSRLIPRQGNFVPNSSYFSTIDL